MDETVGHAFNVLLKEIQSVEEDGGSNLFFQIVWILSSNSDFRFWEWSLRIKFEFYVWITHENEVTEI